MSFPFASWPPQLTQSQQSLLTQLATTYALSHGLLYLPPSPVPPPPSPTSAIHAPLSILPSPVPRNLFENAQRLQRIYNILYARIALDVAFLDDVMGEVARVDPFTGQLWRSWKTLRDEGITEDYHLGIFRSDYLLHAPQAGDGQEPISLKQVEFNTISSSFGALSDRASSLHRYLLNATNYFGLSPYLTKDNLPSNGATTTVVQGLAAAHRAYSVKDAYVLFVVQPGERNVFDQRWLEYGLLEQHNIHVVQQTFHDLLENASLSSTRILTLRNAIPSPPTNPTNEIEISVIYYRAGYTPNDYLTPAYYTLRETLSRARAINCPTLALQLAGGKKVQQVLTKPGVLERFLQPSRSSSSQEVYGVPLPEFGPEEFTDEDLALVRSTWVDMWCLSDTLPSTSEGGVSRALSQHTHLVLKPQREGGGNNVYHTSIPSFLSSLPPSDRTAWIAMTLIEPLRGVGGYLVRAGSGESAAARKDVVSELGVFGWALLGGPDRKGIGKEVEQGDGGWLVRTKGRESDEGGVAVGFSVLDSVLLVD